MSSIVTINSEEKVQDPEMLSKKIQEELYLMNETSEKIIEEIDKIRKFTNPQSGLLTKALMEAAQSSKALKMVMPSSIPDNSES